jgi:hypothetical protein
MNLRDELSEWSYRQVTATLSVGECMLLKESATQFIKEYREKKTDYFTQKFSSTVNISDLSCAYEFLIELEKNNDDLKELKNLQEKVQKNSQTAFDANNDFSFESSDDPFGFELMNQVGEASSKEVTFNLALNALVTVLRVSEAYKKEDNNRINEEASLHESNDWSPPSNFEHGTDDEKEIWEDFQSSQILRK